MQDLMGKEFKVGQLVARSNSHYSELDLAEILDITQQRLRVIDPKHKNSKYLAKGSIVMPTSCVIVREPEE